MLKRLLEEPVLIQNLLLTVGAIVGLDLSVYADVVVAAIALVSTVLLRNRVAPVRKYPQLF